MAGRPLPVERISLECLRLDDRLAPAVFTVTTILDNGNNAVPLIGSLRSAIVSANATPGADTINFQINGGGVQPLAPISALPEITDTVTIDGTTQPGYALTPVIQISGTKAGSANGLVFRDHTGSTVNALTINQFAGAGVLITGGGSHKIQRSFIGVTQNGTAVAGNGRGVSITGGSSVNVVGGAEAERNIISGNIDDGVRIEGGATQNVVSGNYIGTDLNGVNLLANGGSGVAVESGATATRIGGLNSGAGNIISGNTGNGVRIADAKTLGTSVLGNRIGLDLSGGITANGGDGIRILNAVGTTAPPSGIDPRTVINSNTIASNKGTGVSVQDTSRGVQLDNNTVLNNGGLGFNIASTANSGLLAPTITKNIPTLSGQKVSGTLSGRANTQYAVNFFGNSIVDPSGFGEGEIPAGTVSITTDAAGAGSFSFEVNNNSGGVAVTATVTDTTTGDTSNFSNALGRASSGLSASLVAVGSSAGRAATINLYDSDGTLLTAITPFAANFTGGVRVATADFNGDGTPDIVAGTGPGVPTQVRIIDPITRQELFNINPFEASFTGGVYVAAGDLNGDGVAEVIITPDEGGGPRVRVFSGNGFGQLADFFGIDDATFRGGARAAAGDLNNDGNADLIVAAGFGGGPRVAAFSGQSVGSANPVKLFPDFFVFEQSLRNGIFVASGDINSDGFADLIAGGGPGGGPRIFALSGQALTTTNTQVELANFFSGDINSRGGVRLASRDLNGDKTAEIIAGDGDATSVLRIYTGSDIVGNPDAPPRLRINTFPDSPGGIFVG